MRRRIKQCLRVKGSAGIDGDRLDEVYADLASGRMVALMDQEVTYGCRLQIVVTRSMARDLVCLATDLHAQDACGVYRLR